jgi:hypothetical protein
MSEGPSPSASRAATILWPLALVASVHLLTTPGQWLLTDQAEHILVADRLVDRGSLHLSEAGEPRRAELPWVAPARPGEAQRSRLMPLTSIALAPFVLADRAFGSKRPPADRPLVQLQGHVFVLSGLGLVGLALAQHRASAAAIAAALVLTGLAWPVWQVSRRGGTEAIFIFLVALFLLGHARSGDETRPHRPGVVLMALACALLPWGNPTGAILGAALLVGTAAERAWTGQKLGLLAGPILAWAASSAALVVLWNHGYHGHWWLGGYAAHLEASGTVVDAASLPRGIALHLRAMAMESGPLLAVACAGALAGDRRERASLLPPLALIGAMLVVFATFPQPEPTRRLAAALPAWGAAAGRTLGRLQFSLPVRQAVLALAAVAGFYSFWITDGRYHEGPGGLFYPSVVWVRLWIASAPAWQFVLPCTALVVLLVVATGKTSRLLAVDEPAHG